MIPVPVGWGYRDYHMPCFGKALNLTSWDWWFHVFTDTYIKTMLDYDLPEEARGREGETNPTLLEA